MSSSRSNAGRGEGSFPKSSKSTATTPTLTCSTFRTSTWLRRNPHERSRRIHSKISFRPPDYVLALHEPNDHVAVLLRNRSREQTMQRIVPGETIASPPFHAWLKEQNEAGADVYVARNRTSVCSFFAASWVRYGLGGAA